MNGQGLIELQYGHLLNDDTPFIVARTGMVKPGDDAPRGMVNGVSVPLAVFEAARRHMGALSQVTWRQLFREAGEVA